MKKNGGISESLTQPSMIRPPGRMTVAAMVGCIAILLFGVRGAFADANSMYWTNAEDVHNFVYGNLLTTYGSYRIEPGSSESYTWYNASQMYADSAMVLYGDSRYVPYITNTYAWMNYVWDSGSSDGGYFSAANINGTGVSSDQYVDDNSLTGNAYLDCYAVTTGATQTAFLNSAEAIANWLMYSGQWDDTFGGGFWWDTGKSLKPTQSNGLAMQLFLRLYQITGQSYYQSWANSVRSWLESQMYDSTNGLYVWEIVTNGTPSGAKSYVEFAYDNAVMMDADLLYYQVMHTNSYLPKAEAIATNLNQVLWNSTYGSYYINTANGDVSPTYSGWVSQSLIQLYQVDGNTTWLNYAQSNINYMNLHLYDTNVDGYYQYCNMDGAGVETNDMQEVDQAWMERIQALLSNYR
ncbi:MAG TPA: glycoside hydrolase family 76 protein [Candidatus Sulfotelmatobacter sp.]|nr:glycoside hydrolase family 76 protein [Candidatus Sulfotelmatobacter sp.]